MRSGFEVSLIVLSAVVFGCAGRATRVVPPNERDERLEQPDDREGTWAYIQIPNDRDFDQVEPLTGSSPDPKEMPADPNPRRRASDDASGKPISFTKCNVDGDCPSPKVCLRPPGGPHPFGICGESVDHLGRPTPNRRVRGCGVGLACPGGTRCVMAYGEYGVCFR